MQLTISKFNALPNTGESLELVTLKEALEYSNNYPKRTYIPGNKAHNNDQKRRDGSIFPYTNGSVVNNGFVSGGIIFIDIDNLGDADADKIFNGFDIITSMMSNVVACNFSFSHNVHFFIYDSEVKNDATKYEEKARLWLMCIAEIINQKLNIDLKSIDGALDLHNTKISQRFFLNNTEFKYNDLCCDVTLDDKTIKKLESIYGEISTNRNNTVKRDLNHSNTKIDGNVTVDKSFFISGYNGFDARTRIASTAYVHFNEDLNAVWNWLASIFTNAEEIYSQLTSMIRRDYPARYFSKEIEMELFPQDLNNYIILEQDQYLSDVLSIDDIDEKYIYIESNTNTGKTEFIKKELKNHDNIVFIQMNKALRDGKKHGIEDFTYTNWGLEWEGVCNKVHTTIDGVINHFNTFEGYTVILDESHLLESYVGFRYDEILSLLNLLKTADKLVFMSATPASDLDLFDFKVLKYRKIQPQTLYIDRIPLNVSGNGSKCRAKFETICGFCKSWYDSTEAPVVIFSNKKQKEWKANGIDDLASWYGVTYFNSNNFQDSDVQALLKDNKLTNPITLATIYMGVGVEIKGEYEVHFVFDLDEGFDYDFIVQSIGRARDAHNIYVHLFDSSSSHRTIVSTDSVKNLINECFDKLILQDEDIAKINLVAAHHLQIFDAEFDKRESSDLCKILKLGVLARNYQVFSVVDADIMKNLPYEKSIMIMNSPINLNSNGKKCRKVEETELEEYLLSLDNNKREKLLNKLDNVHEYSAAINDLPFKDKVNAGKLLNKFKFILNHPSMNIGEKFNNCIKVCGSISKAYATFKNLNEMLNYECGHYIIQEMDNEICKDYAQKILNNINRVKVVFDSEYIKYCMSIIKNEDFEGVVIKSIEFDNEKEERIGFFEGDVYSQDFIESKKGKKSSGKIGGKIGGKISSPICIKNEETGEIKRFDNKTECMKFLNLGSQSFSKFVKGAMIKKVQYWKVIA